MGTFYVKAFIVVLAFLCSSIEGSTVGRLGIGTCPNAEDILPCVCTSYADFTMDMDCSAVLSSNQLALAFSANFPFPDFKNLYIRNNTHITSLRVGDLGTATFTKITITDGKLESVVDKALINSYATLTVLDLSRNHLTSFPFEEIKSFKYLTTFTIEKNAIFGFPSISSSSLTTFLLGYNPIRTMSSTDIKGMPNLKTIGLHNAQLTSIAAGTFTGLSKLQTVHLEGNSLTTLLANTIQVTGTDNYVHLNSNNLITIQSGAIKGASYEIWIDNNELTELYEDVWRPLFDAYDGLRLSSSNNPLSCSCEIAWIVLNVNYLKHLVDNPRCQNGEYVLELDPAIYNQLCT